MKRKLKDAWAMFLQSWTTPAPRPQPRPCPTQAEALARLRDAEKRGDTRGIHAARAEQCAALHYDLRKAREAGLFDRQVTA